MLFVLPFACFLIGVILIRSRLQYCVNEGPSDQTALDVIDAFVRERPRGPTKGPQIQVLGLDRE